MTTNAADRIFEAVDPTDDWARAIGQFDKPEAAFQFAYDESVRYARRMLVLPPSRRQASRARLVHPANTCQNPRSWWYNPGNKRCDQPIGHDGRHQCTSPNPDGTKTWHNWDDNPYPHPTPATRPAQ